MTDIDMKALRRVARGIALLDGVAGSQVWRAVVEIDCLRAENEALRKVWDAATSYMEFAMNPRDNGVGEIEARATLFRTLEACNEHRPATGKDTEE